MYFITLLLPAFATSTLAAVLPRLQEGAWNVTITKQTAANGYTAQTVLAQFVSDAYLAPGIVSTCKYEDNPANTPSVTSGCDNEAFEYEYDGQTVKLKQSVKLPTPRTVFGDAPLELKVVGAVGRSYKGNAIVEVTSAIA